MYAPAGCPMNPTRPSTRFGGSRKDAPPTPGVDAPTRKPAARAPKRRARKPAARPARATATPAPAPDGADALAALATVALPPPPPPPGSPPKLTLPDGWAAVKTNDGRTYYHNKDENKCAWEHPAAPPAAKVSASTRWDTGGEQYANETLILLDAIAEESDKIIEGKDTGLLDAGQTPWLGGGGGMGPVDHTPSRRSMKLWRMTQAWIQWGASSVSHLTHLSDSKRDLSRPNAFSTTTRAFWM